MTRTSVMASSRPHKDGALSSGVTSSGGLRRLSTISALLLLTLALMLPATALAASGPTSNYGTPPPTPTPTTPSSGTAPSKEASEPSNSTAPTTTSTTSPETAKSTLPFTGFDLRWSLAIGVLLIAGGFTIVAMQRRQRSDS